MGELPCHLKVEHEITKLERSIEAVSRSHPKSRFTIVRAILKAH